jgi:hypothetical protein
MLGSLDNEVIFKKAFTDKIVFEAFVKDVLGIEITVGTIETEKKFTPPIGYVDFELDIFAETVDKRTIIELQRAQYDYNFDRFMHYLQMFVEEQQKNASKYKVKQTVYLIVIMTLPYKFNDLTGEAVKEEVIVTKFCSKNLNGKEIPIYAHQMVCLNPNHPEPDTPQALRDWLDLFYQSIHSPERPNINLSNAGISRAANLIDFTNLTPQQLAEAKNKEQNAVVKSIYHAEGRQDEKADIALNAIHRGFDDELIAELTGLSIEKIQEIRKENMI